MSHSERKNKRQARTISRRGFLTGVSAAAAGLVLAGCAPTSPTEPAPAVPTAAGATAASKPTVTGAPTVIKRRTLNFLRGTSYIKDEDTWFSTYLVEKWAKPNNVDLVVETLSSNDMTAKIAVALETGAGADIIRFAWDQPLLYASSLMDVGDIAQKQAADGGGHYDAMKAFCSDKGTWLAVPWGMVGNAIQYRSDWLKELGETEFPKTFEEYNRVGKLMKQKKNAPTGQVVAHDTGDARHVLYPLMWSFGAKEVLEDGKTVAINSPEARECLEFFKVWFNDSLSPEMLGWDGNSNNRAYLGEQIWATNNAASLYLEAKAKFPDLAKATGLALNPMGPKGRFHTAGPHSHSIPKYVKDPAPAKELLSFMSQPEVYSDFMNASKGYTSAPVKVHENHPIWAADANMSLFKDVSFYLWPGYPAPPSAKSGEVVNKYIIMDMFAKVAQGTPIAEVLSWTEAELSRIYGKA